MKIKPTSPEELSKRFAEARKKLEEVRKANAADMKAVDRRIAEIRKDSEKRNSQRHQQIALVEKSLKEMEKSMGVKPVKPGAVNREVKRAVRKPGSGEFIARTDGLAPGIGRKLGMGGA